jgi:hypothetical protein
MENNPEDKKRKPLHRDDIDMDIAEEITYKLSEMFPGFKIAFAGDVPEAEGDEVNENVELLNKKFEDSLNKGICFDCGRQMDKVPQNEKEIEQKRKEGWGTLGSFGDDTITAWICPKCENEEWEDGEIRKVEFYD